MQSDQYSDLSYISLNELLHSSNSGKRFKVRAFVTDIDGPEVLLSYNWIDKVDLNGETIRYFDKVRNLPLYKIQIQDELGGQATLKYFFDENKIPELRDSLRNPVFKDFILEFHLFYKLDDFKLKKIDRGEFVVLCIDVLDSDAPYQQLQASENEITRTKRMLSNFSPQSTLFDHLKSKLIANLKIQEIKKSPELEIALEHTIIQALSAGIINNHSGKLHSLLIGPPGTGKKLISESIMALNTVSYQADPMKISMPGIVGSAVRKKEGWRSQPGLIPLSNNGAFIIQDFHAISNTLKKQLYGAFTMVMEDGEIADSTSAKQRHPALTSIHLDLNKLSEIYLKETKPYSPSEKLTDIQLPINILTRFDSIVMLERDVKRQFEIATSMSEREPEITRTRKDLLSENWTRELRLLIAGALEQYFVIRIPTGVRKYVKEKQSDLYNENKSIIDRLSLVGDYQTRLSTSIHKYLFAIARVNLRDHVIRGDVDQAFKFIKYKFRFIKSVLDELKIPASWDKPKYDIFDRSSRQEYLKSRFRGKNFTVNDIHTAINEDYDHSVTIRTLYRDAAAVGVVVRKIGKTKVYKIKN